MAEELRHAGRYFLDSFKIYHLGKPEKSVDIKFLVHTWELNESMERGHLFGTAKVYDGAGVLDHFLENGLRGEEEIEISYRDFFEVNPKTHRFFLYAVTDVTSENNANQTMNSYRIHFASIDKVYTENETIRRAFNNTKVSDNVKSVFDEFFLNSKKPIEIEETSGVSTLVVPNYSPEDTMHFFTRNAYSDKYRSQTFRFFENRDQYFFATHEYINEEINSKLPIVKFRRYDKSDQDIEQEMLMTSIVDISFPEHVNTFKDMSSGAYYRSVTELDVLNRTALRTQFRYLDEYDKYKSPNSNIGDIHSKAFAEKQMNELRDTLIFKDYSSPGTTKLGMKPYTFFPDIYNSKRSAMYHHDRNIAVMKIHGRNDIVAGSLIEVNLAESFMDNEGVREVDKWRTGKYLVEGITNEFYETNFYQTLYISKSGFNRKPDPSSSYPSQPQAISYGR